MAEEGELDRGPGRQGRLGEASLVDPRRCGGDREAAGRLGRNGSQQQQREGGQEAQRRHEHGPPG